MGRKHHNYGTYIGEVIACEVLGDCDKQHYPMPLHFEYEYAYKHEDELHKRYDGDKQAIDILDGRNKCGCEVVQALDEQLMQFRVQIRTSHHDAKQGIDCSHKWCVSEKGVEGLSCDRLALIKRAVECKVKKAGKYQRIIGKPVDLFVELNIDAVPHETAEDAVHELVECYRGIDGIEGFRYIYTPIQIYEPACVQVYRYDTKDGKCELLAAMQCHEYNEYTKRAEERIAKW